MRVRLWIVGLLLSSLMAAGSASPVLAGFETGFGDVGDNDVFAEPITWLRLAGITNGCNPPGNTSFCPDDPVTRGQMAAFLVRALDLGPPAVVDRFRDDDNSVFEADIDRLADAGITLGCNPPDNTAFCPEDVVSREQMAAFLVRGFRLPPSVATNLFVDTGNSTFADDIDALTTAGLTAGCNPPDNNRFCPGSPVGRAEMAAFLWRAMSRPAAEVANRIVAAGDIGQCSLSSDEATAELLDRSFSDTNGVVAALGDTVYNDGSARQYEDCYQPNWGRHRFRTRPAVGNHEYRTPDASGYFDYFGAAAGDPAEGWYSYTVGAWQVVVLNSNCDEIDGCDAGSDQEQWLRAELESNTHLCTMAYMHHPRFSSGVHGDDDRLEDLWQALDDHNVEVALAGHDHNYERLAPLTASGTLAGPDGIQSFVVGTGGTYLRTVDTPRPGSQVLIDDHHGVLMLDLNDTGYGWRFVEARDGDVLDSGIRECS